MGRNYSFNLYYRVEDLDIALLEAAWFCEPEKHRIDVTLPGSKVIQLPFTSNLFKTDPVEIQQTGYSGTNQSFATVLRFPNNPDVTQYLKDQSKESHYPFDPHNFGVGYIYLGVYCGQTYAELSYMACCNSMSDLFLKSKGVQERFIELAQASRALGGVISVEEEAYRSLFDPQCKIEIPTSPREDEEDWDDEIVIDTYIPTILQTLREMHQSL